MFDLRVFRPACVVVAAFLLDIATTAVLWMAIRSLAIRVSAAAAILVLVSGSIPPVHAACNVSDMGDAAEAVYDTGKDLLTSQCAAMAPNPGFWALVAGFSAGTTSTPQLRDACNTIQEVADTAGDSKEKADSALNKLPADIKKLLQEKLPVGAANDIISGVLGPLAWAACACKMANSAAIAKVYDVAGACFKDALCGLDAVILGNSCEAAPQGIFTVDCTKGVIGFGWTPVGNGLYVNKQGASIQGKAVGWACTCPKPMVFGTLYSSAKDFPGCYANGKVTTEGCRACVCPYPTKQVAMGICICPDGSPALPNGSCPAPCKGSCPTGQILKRSVRLANGQCSSECVCPPGQTMTGGKCQWPPCAGQGETRLPGGVCCAKDKVSACGTCCVGGQLPDAATGQCVAMSIPNPATPAPNEVPAAPEPKQEVPEGATPPAAKPDENAKPILFRLRKKAAPPFSPVKW